MRVQPFAHGEPGPPLTLHAVPTDWGTVLTTHPEEFRDLLQRSPDAVARILEACYALQPTRVIWEHAPPNSRWHVRGPWLSWDAHLKGVALRERLGAIGENVCVESDCPIRG